MTRPDVKPVVCPECGKRFSTKQSMRQHFRAKHEGKKDKRFRVYAPWDWDGYKWTPTMNEAEQSILGKANAWIEDPAGKLLVGKRYHLVKF